MTWEGLTPPYRTIVADPPWRYNKTKGLPTGGYKPSTAEAHYSTMSMSEIAALPVGDLAADDAHLYLWVTNARLFGDRNDDGVAPIDIVRAWGFEYKTLLTWEKAGRLGMGWWFRGQTEHVMFCTRPRGVPIPSEKRLRNFFSAPVLGHSIKPAAFFEIVHAVSPPPHVELFSRQPRLGWDSWGWGAEIESGRNATDLA